MMRLVARDVYLQRGERQILARIEFAAAAGAFIGVIGPNGAGKSSLLEILAGLLAPTSGEALLDGRPIRDWPARDLARQRGYLPQRPVCEWPISVGRLVALGLMPTLAPFAALPTDQSAAVCEVLDSFGLATLRGQAVPTLSGGEFSRAMLARAMVGRPDILIVDEPFAGLDPRHALGAARRLAAYAAGGKLVIAAMHEIDLALAHTTHVLALREGRCAAYGSTGETLSAALIEALFDVPAELHRSADGAWIRFRPLP